MARPLRWDYSRLPSLTSFVCVCVVYFTTLWISQNMEHRKREWLRKDELAMVWKIVAASYHIHYPKFAWRNLEKPRISCQDSRCPSRDWNPALLFYISGAISLQQPVLSLSYGIHIHRNCAHGEFNWISLSLTFDFNFFDYMDGFFKCQYGIWMKRIWSFRVLSTQWSLSRRLRASMPSSDWRFGYFFSIGSCWYASEPSGFHQYRRCWSREKFLLHRGCVHILSEGTNRNEGMR
jgi:hypothetical protein